MSYEGHEQCICKNGHYFERDCYDEDGVCDTCQAKDVWCNGVDHTNGDADGLIPYEVLKEKFHLEDAVLEVCNLGHTHLIKEETFRVPTQEETQPLRTYRYVKG